MCRTSSHITKGMAVAASSEETSERHSPQSWVLTESRSGLLMCHSGWSWCYPSMLLHSPSCPPWTAWLQPLESQWCSCHWSTPLKSHSEILKLVAVCPTWLILPWTDIAMDWYCHGLILPWEIGQDGCLCGRCCISRLYWVTQFSVGSFPASVSPFFPQSILPPLSCNKCHRQVPNQSRPQDCTGPRVVYISINLQTTPLSDCHHRWRAESWLSDFSKATPLGLCCLLHSIEENCKCIGLGAVSRKWSNVGRHKKKLKNGKASLFCKRLLIF